MLSTWRDSQPCTLLMTCCNISTSSPLPIKFTLAVSGPIASCLDASAKAIDLAQNHLAIPRCLDLLQTEPRFVTPVVALGRRSGRVLRQFFGPKVFEVDQEELGFAC